MISLKRTMVIVGVLLFIGALAFGSIAYADHYGFPTGISATCGSSTIFVTIAWSGSNPGGSFNLTVWNQTKGPSVDNSGYTAPVGAAVVTYAANAPDSDPGDQIRIILNGPSDNGTSEDFVYECSEGGYTPPNPTAIWLAHVCEPFDGFSGDGWTTVGSDAASKPWGTTLYVAASGEGPWVETEFLQPPYIISQSQMDALAALVGVESPNDVWMRAGNNGIAANYGSMVEDREAIMDSLCGS